MNIVTVPENKVSLEAGHIEDIRLASTKTSRSGMSEVLNRNGYRLRPVIKAKPQKKVPETDAIFANIQAHDRAGQGEAIMRVSIDCKATVNIGDYSRGGKTLGDNPAADHDRGGEEKHTPFGVVNEDSGHLHLSFGSSAKTSDFIVDSLYAWWASQSSDVRARASHLQIKADNGPESNGRRTQFLKRIVEFADHIGKSIRLLYYPPYHIRWSVAGESWKSTGTVPN
jgi:hypothetical protein